MQEQTAGSGNAQIYITMFGGFSVSSGTHSISDSAMRTHQLWHLIEYLIAFRNKTVSQEELIQVLWPDNKIDNPANALKNLVYRIRSTFSSKGIPHAREMIVYYRGQYQWNNNLVCQVDTELFDRLHRLAMDSSTSPERKVRLCQDAIELYTGDFLPNSRYEIWVIPLAAEYKRKYFECVYAALELLYAKERYGEMEAICRKALAIDQFEETCHKYLMLSLIGQERQSQAISHYSFVTDLFFRELGVSPSDSMRNLYRDIVKTLNNVEIDIGIIQEDLRESSNTSGAFYCEYEVFKNLYRLEARTAMRTGQTVFICLLTVENQKPGEPLEMKTRNKAMDALYEIIHSRLRKGDVFSRFSASQFVLMLPTMTYENCEMVMSRIIKHYKNTYRPKTVAITAKVQPLDPIELSV